MFWAAPAQLSHVDVFAQKSFVHLLLHPLGTLTFASMFACTKHVKRVQASVPQETTPPPMKAKDKKRADDASPAAKAVRPSHIIMSDPTHLPAMLIAWMLAPP